MTFEEFFRAATDGRTPYSYQVEFANGRTAPELLIVPTGAGKTATAILGWLYRRRFHPIEQVRHETPRRLVYCLPMRTLCEQTAKSTAEWLNRLGLAATASQQPGSAVHTHLLMGGEETGPWTQSVGEDQILIGTQDMLLSRALNRGYGASRFQWPIEFALLNNDCAWVFDEPQLMANGVRTSAQLTGLRSKLATTLPCTSLWMSATLEPEWLQTVDLPGPLTVSQPTYPRRSETLASADQELADRLDAPKTLRLAPEIDVKDEKSVARFVCEHHIDGTQTLVIVNTVDRARKLFESLRSLAGRPGGPAGTPELLLIHSRYRPVERGLLNERLISPSAAGSRIVVATQVVEAGVDISARTLITELAPWPSLVQRFGRCNRTAREPDAAVYLLDLPPTHAAPYDPRRVVNAREWVLRLEGTSVSPRALAEFTRAEEIRDELPVSHTLRRRDLLDLFDTTPDLSGQDVDVQRFVRSDEPDTDVGVFWRDLSANEQPTTPTRDELCSVPLSEFREFVKDRKQRQLTRFWDHLADAWRILDDPQRELRPGQTVCLDLTAGGYCPELGWSKKETDPVAPVPGPQNQQPEGVGSDPLSSLSRSVTLAAHTQNVLNELQLLCEQLAVTGEWRDYLLTAGLWHDIGKSHPVFQTAVRQVNPQLSEAEAWAKSGSRGSLRYARPYFRHELASALGACQLNQPFPVCYLVGAHHGRVRLGIRSGPDETGPADPGQLFALGIHQGDSLPAIELGALSLSPMQLDLAPMQLGGDATWTGRALQLLDQLGPFRLAWFEAILRLADQRASAAEAAS